MSHKALQLLPTEQMALRHRSGQAHRRKQMCNDVDRLAKKKDSNWYVGTGIQPSRETLKIAAAIIGLGALIFFNCWLAVRQLDVCIYDRPEYLNQTTGE